jgi:gamma-glutamyltranspeptidase
MKEIVRSPLFDCQFTTRMTTRPLAYIGYTQMLPRYELHVTHVVLTTMQCVVFIQILASSGKKGFYEGRIADAIVAACASFGGVMSTDDLMNHVSTFEEPISTDFKTVKLWETPPNSQGIVALMTLNLLETFDLKGK